MRLKRTAYGRAVAAFLAWCDDNQVQSIDAVQQLHGAAWIERQTRPPQANAYAMISR